MLRQLCLFLEALNDVRFQALQYILLPQLFSMKRIIPPKLRFNANNRYAYEHDVKCGCASDIFYYYSFYVYLILVFLMQSIIFTLFPVI